MKFDARPSSSRLHMGFAVWPAKKCPKGSCFFFFFYFFFFSFSFLFFLLPSWCSRSLIDATNKGAEPGNSGHSFSFYILGRSVCREVRHKYRTISICSSDDNGWDKACSTWIWGVDEFSAYRTLAEGWNGIFGGACAR